MKSNTVKKLALAVLLLVFVYIWWGNLKMFFSESSYSEQAFQIRTPTDSQAVQPGSLQYQPPQVNPFRRPAPSTKTQPAKPTAAKQQAKPLPRLSAQYALAGVVTEKGEPQAVVRLPDGSSTIVTLGDSIEQWELAEINKRHVVFRHKKERDTLWLGDPGK